METLSHSRLAAFKECRRQYFYRYERGLVQKERPLPLSFGGAFHAGIAAWYRCPDGARRVAEGMAAINGKMSVALAAARDEQQMQEVKNAAGLAFEVFQRYAEQYAQEDFRILAVEPELKVPIINPKTRERSKLFDLAIRPDLVVEREDGIFIKETKTAKTIDSRYKSKLTLDPQSLLYVVGYGQSSGTRCAGVIYDVVLKSIPVPPKQLKGGALSVDKGQCTTAELFEREIHRLKLKADEYADMVSWLRANPRTFFWRETIAFPQEDRNEWKEELWQLTIDLSEARRRGRWYKNPTNCLRTGTCAYWQVCTAIDREWVLSEQFITAEEQKAADALAENDLLF